MAEDHSGQSAAVPGGTRLMPPGAPRPTPPVRVTGARVAALAEAVAGGETGAVAAFWAEAADCGTPLVEPVPGDADHHVVTFLWRDDADRRDAAHAVLLVANRLTDRLDPAPTLMARVPGTDIWHASYRIRADWRATYQLLPYRDAPPDPAAGIDRETWLRISADAVPDPLNPRRFPTRRGEPRLSLVELPAAPPQPWREPRDATASGVVTAHRLHSTVLGNERQVWVYTPAEYAPTGYGYGYGLAVLLDGEVWGHHIPIASTLDNLIAAGRIPPLVAVMPDSLGPDVRWRELACHQPFLDFLTGELLPWTWRQWAVAAVPSRTLIAGQSLGGLTAAFAGLRASGHFGNVLSQSGSFWWRQGSEYDVDAEWLTRQYAVEPRRPVRFHLDVGLQEWVLLPTNRHLRNVLEAKGYDVSYAEYNGGHDYACWIGTLATGLQTLTADWRDGVVLPDLPARQHDALSP